jgi:hypothetical protein
MFKLEKCSNSNKNKIWKMVKIWKVGKLKNHSNSKFVQIQKPFNFGICSNSKTVQFWNLFEFENCSNLKNVQIRKLFKFKLFRFKTEKKWKKVKNKLGRPNIPGVGVRWSVRTDRVGGQDLPFPASPFTSCFYFASNCPFPVYFVFWVQFSCFSSGLNNF